MQCRMDGNSVIHLFKSNNHFATINYNGTNLCLPYGCEHIPTQIIALVWEYAKGNSKITSSGKWRWA